MLRIWALFKSIILWAYERGSWQYDVMVVVILAFVFATPNMWFEPSNRKGCEPPAIYIEGPLLSKSEQPQGTIDELVASYIRKKRGDEFRIDKIELKIDANKRVLGYCVWVDPANPTK